MWEIIKDILIVIGWIAIVALLIALPFISSMAKFIWEVVKSFIGKKK